MLQKQNVKYLAGKMTTCRHLLFPAILTLLIMAAMQAWLPIQIQHILHAVYLKQDDSYAQRTLLTIILLVCIYCFARFAGQYWIRKTEHQLRLKIQDDVFNKLLVLPAWQHAPLEKQLVMETLLSGIKKIARKTLGILTVLMHDTLALCALIACLAYLNEEFTLLICILIPFVFLIVPIIIDQQPQNPGIWSQAVRNKTTKLVHQLQFIFKNFRHVHLFGGQQQEYRRLNDMAQSIVDEDNQQDNYNNFVSSLCLLLLCLIIMAITYLMIQQALEQNLLLDQAGALFAATLLLVTPVRRLSVIPRQLQQLDDSLNQLIGLLNTPSDSPPGKRIPKPTRGNLVLADIDLLDQRKTPCLFDLTIETGETVALITNDDALKTQIMDSLLGFHVPETGEIKFDDLPYREIDANDLLAQFAVISRTPIILDDRVAGNIAYGGTECSHEACITRIAQTTGISGFVREMPEGLQTRVDKSGASLTVQQWQLIAIARALLKNAPVLIIDDLWPQRQSDVSSDVFKALQQTMRDRTNILLLKTLPEYRGGIDRILVVEKGAVTVLSKNQ